MQPGLGLPPGTLGTVVLIKGLLEVEWMELVLVPHASVRVVSTQWCTQKNLPEVKKECSVLSRDNSPWVSLYVSVLLAASWKTFALDCFS